MFDGRHIHSDEKKANMKTFSSVIIFGVGLLLGSGSLVHAQYGNMGEAVKKGAGDAGKEALMKGAAEKAGLAAPGAPTATQGADAGAANAPAGDADVAPEAAAEAALVAA
jgi:hypothetical protein